MNLVGIAADNAQVAHAKPHVQRSTGSKVTSLGVSLFVVPMVRSKTEWNQKQTGENYLAKHGEANEGSSKHRAPPERTSAWVWYVKYVAKVPGDFVAACPGQTYPLKSATPSQTSWTAMARIRKPKMRLIAPTAPGPSRRTSGPPIHRNKKTDKPTATMPITMPR